MGCLSIVGRLVSTFARRDVFDPILAANVRPTLTEGACQTNEGADQMNRLRNSRSGAFSLSRVKTMSKYPLEFSVHAEALTDTTALHMRSSVGGIMSENS